MLLKEEKTRRIVIGVGVLVIVLIAALTVNGAQPGSISRFLTFLLHDIVKPASVSISSKSAANVTSTTNPASYIKCSFNTSSTMDADKILFDKIAWMGDKNNSANEWFSLQKISSGALDVSGYQILSKNESIKIILPPKTVLSDDKPVFLLARQYDIPGIAADLVFSGAVKNSNEGLRLFNDNCGLLDEAMANPDWPAGDNSTKDVMERDLKSLAWFDASHPLSPAKNIKQSSPVATNSQQAGSVNPPSHILISEIMAGATGNSGWEFVELYNPNSEEVDLSGWSLEKKSSAGSKSILVSSSRWSGKTISAGKYFLLANGGGYGGIVPADVLWPASYSLAYASNTLELYNPDGMISDAVFWNNIPEGKSYARVPSDGGSFIIQEVPTPKNSSS
ncbi:MAG: lamin tail domain-containing protein [Patescibacteria group bacterium]|nr:lamin tail domain-containing protein [Patescibacteria group bacterium]MDE2015063.1 lamin tail domain-containing protein [Patescibacteria group bacterium]MDE2226491.1 lamin tail domain-containing protein [Patescibacteria group bacterium]